MLLSKMKFCGACCKELPKESFSNKQYKLKQHQRRCKECIDANAELQLEAPPKKKDETSEDETNKPECWICLDDGPDENGGMPTRDCSCRGGSGYVHLTCVASYAEEKIKSNLQVESHPWQYCPICHHEYLNNFAIDLAKLYLACMERAYKTLPLHISIVQAQICLLENLMTVNPDIMQRNEAQIEEAKRIANDILRKVRRMKVKGTISSRARIFEAYSYECLGNCYQVEAVKVRGSYFLYNLN